MDGDAAELKSTWRRFVEALTCPQRRPDGMFAMRHSIIEQGVQLGGADRSAWVTSDRKHGAAGQRGSAGQLTDYRVPPDRYWKQIRKLICCCLCRKSQFC